MTVISAEGLWSTNIRPEDPHAVHSTNLLSTTFTRLLLLRRSCWSSNCCLLRSNMEMRFSLSVSWICLLLFGSAASFPATKGDYRYPYTATWGSSGEPAPAFQPASAPETQSSSSVVAVSSQSYEPSSFTESSPNSPTSFSFGDGPVPYAAAPSSFDSNPWVYQPAGGADASFYDFSNWMPSQPFPDFRVWGSASASNDNIEMSQSASETSPLPPSSYIIQSSNGYMRAREVLSNTRYSPDYYEPSPFPFKNVGAPSKSGPVTGTEGRVKM